MKCKEEIDLKKKKINVLMRNIIEKNYKKRKKNFKVERKYEREWEGERSCED